MKWQWKWLKNAAIGLVPFSDSLRQWKRRLNPYPADVPHLTLEEGFRTLDMLREAEWDIRGKTVLEIGSGWRPIIPLLMSLQGASRIVLVDAQRLMDQNTFACTVERLARYSAEIANRLGIDESTVQSFFATPPKEWDALLRRFKMEYAAPCDLIASDMADGQFDLVFSRAVLEHVPPGVLTPLIKRAFQLLRPGGWTFHAIDNSDHWSHDDHRLSRVNFLRYSDRAFNLLNRFNPLDYQNRLRHSEYERLFHDIGFEIQYARSAPEARALDDLKSLPLSPRFRSFTHEDLARLDSYFLCRRPMI